MNPVNLTTDQLLKLRAEIQAELDARAAEPCDHEEHEPCTFLKHPVERCAHCLRVTLDKVRWFSSKDLPLDAVSCSHEIVKDYSWEWDSGYGKQERMTGHLCRLCWSADPWRRGRWHKSPSLDPDS